MKLATPIKIFTQAHTFTFKPLQYLSTKTEAANKVIEAAIIGVKDWTCVSVSYAMKELGFSEPTFQKRGKSRSEAQDQYQLLRKNKETTLAKWISSSVASGNPVQHEFVCKMVQKLWKQCIAPDNL